MKTKFYSLILFASILILSACSSSDDDLPSDSFSTLETPVPFSLEFHDLIQQETDKLNDNALFKAKPP